MTPADALKISSDSRVASTIPLYSNLKFESPKADVSLVAGDINLSDPFRSKFELPASFQLAMDKDNTTSSKTLSLTVVLGDGEDMDEVRKSMALLVDPRTSNYWNQTMPFPNIVVMVN